MNDLVESTDEPSVAQKELLNPNRAPANDFAVTVPADPSLLSDHQRHLEPSTDVPYRPKQAGASASTTLLKALHNLPVPSFSPQITSPAPPSRLQEAPSFYSKPKNDYFASKPPGSASPNSRSMLPTGDGLGLDSDTRRQASLFSRLVALASPTTEKVSSAPTSHPVETSLPADPAHGSQLEEPTAVFDLYEQNGEDGDLDSDIDRSAQGNFLPRRRKKRFRGHHPSEMSSPNSMPATPRQSRFPSFLRDSSRVGTPVHGAQDALLSAYSGDSATLNHEANPSLATRIGHVSEDEGRQRFAKFKRGQSSSAAIRRDPTSPGHESRRPAALRRLTNLAGPDGPMSPLRPKFDKAGTTGQQKWRQVKAGLKLLGTRKNERVKIDYQKSTELMAQLLAGSPAALFLATMYQRDEHGNKKIPALLEQLKISIPSSSTRDDMSGGRHMTFTINLEYGNGPSRMAWTIHRSLRDFISLHTKYKAHHGAAKFKREDRHRAKIPKFPKTAFPYLRSVRGLADEEADEHDGIGDSAVTDGERPDMGQKRRQSSFILSKKPSFIRRRPSSINADHAESSNQVVSPAKKEAAYQDRQRKMLEVYLQSMIRWLVFRPESTRLCKFLELSAIAMRLAVEGGYHGKEAFMTIASKRTVERRGLLALRALPGRLKTSPQRHRPKWFLVRHSYIVAVASPESLEPVEVFMVDSDFATDQRKRLRDQSAQEMAKTAKASAQAKYHSIKLYNSERKLRLIAKNERQYMQVKESIEHMVKNTVWSQKQRFDSFAPVRKGVFARWLVDGRDHMWQVSRAIDNARNFVYIHDWWLSPELYLRRPAASSPGWRLDRLLLRKAQQGVKIFIIVYRNIESAIPIDSEHTKTSLLDLHPNICIQRSPNQFRQNQFFWAHHEKLVVCDNAIAFVGGVDLCFGRWDEPSHSLVDDKATGFDPDIKGARNAANSQVWPGKDYSNPRILDFFNLDKPFEEMYDRHKIPRMPWHDISMQIVGQPARDVGRHFVQRWNYILRQRTPSRPTPVLLPPPDFEREELERLGMDGTCQIQILRSCAQWSMGTPNKIECSIQNAYVHLIEKSEHFIYIENQFFISSCVVEGVQIVNRIGDALVERIIRAHQQNEDWRACIIIPLMPGFQNSVDAQDGSSIRLIMQCQFRSICRGESSIFGRLRTHGIDPRQYIEFYALRQWGKIGQDKGLTTEQLYIHAKCMIVDDRYCIIGSANINERSMLGNRDSEVAAVVADQEMMPSFMNGKPYNVGVFPHSLRMRLMREHLGLDVDSHAHEAATEEEEPYPVDQDSQNNTAGLESHLRGHSTVDELQSPTSNKSSISGRPGRSSTLEHAISPDSVRHRIETSTIGQLFSPIRENTVKSAIERHDQDVAGHGVDSMAALTEAGVTGARETIVDAHGHEVLIAPDIEGDIPLPSSAPLSPTTSLPGSGASPQPPWGFPRMTTRDIGMPQLSQLPALPVTDDTDIGGPSTVRPVSASSSNLLNAILKANPVVNYECMRDPLINTFYGDIWHRVAENNTKLYRQVFRCMPDSEVISWREYRDFQAYSEKFMHSQGLGKSVPRAPKNAPGTSGPPGSIGLSPDVETDLKSALRTSSMSNGAVSSRTASKLSGIAEKILGSKSSTLSVPGQQEQLDEKSRLEASSRESDTSTPQHNNSVSSEKAAAKQADEADPADPSRNTSTGGGVHFDAHVDEESLSHTETRNTGSPIGPETTITQPSPVPPQTTATTDFQPPRSASTSKNGTAPTQGTAQRRRRATTRSGRPSACPEEVLSKAEAEELLNKVQGHLVLWPYDWLEREEAGGNWLYNIDQIAPLEI